MKKYIIHIGIVLVAMIIFSCNKNSEVSKPGYVGISKITYYADFKVSGDEYMAIPKGTPYTEPGVTASAEGKDIKVTVTGSVNTSQVGVYLITYSATNSDGFPASFTRYVAVYSTDASAQNNDFSGSYARSAPGTANDGVVATWTKIAPGVYVVVNPGGAPSATLTVFVFNPTGNSIKIPEQIAGGASTSSSSEVTTPGSVAGTLSQYKWIIVNPGYGTSLRTFNKK